MSDEPPDLPQGQYRSAWPGDLRAPCPVLNTLANHGLIARDGRNITSDELKSALQYLSLGLDVAIGLVNTAFKVHTDDPNSSAPGESDTGFRDRDQVNENGVPVLNLDQVGRPHAIEHDVSITRQDRALGDCINLNPDLYERFLQSAEDGRSFGIADIGKYRKKRFEEQKRDNTSMDFSKTSHYIACGEVGGIICVFGEGLGYRVPKEYIQAVFGEERLPLEEGWKPRWWKVYLVEAAAVILGISSYAWPF
ncbi:Chloroperoxidase [Aspergillus avenaceus]|uniref:Chloroperoxidase n=1 Tax=Aspergillus avenaceus TaxID=36643 RepID=A0A5N6U6J7_ASPAV|nr:Chloroperoxidase [Aspergillus avenaceus]